MGECVFYRELRFRGGKWWCRRMMLQVVELKVLRIAWCGKSLVGGEAPHRHLRQTKIISTEAK